MSQAHQFLATAASDAQRPHCGWYTGDHRRVRHDEPSHDDVLVADSVDRLLLDEEGEPEIPIAQVFWRHAAGNINVLHYGRFYKHNSHVVASQGLVVFVAQDGSKHGLKPYTSYDHAFDCGESQSVTPRGYRSVHSAAILPRISIRPAGERLAQITDQGPGDGIGQDNARHDAVFIRMGDPGNQPDITVDRLDIDAGREGIGNHNRFCKGRVVLIVGHRSGFHSLPLIPLSVADTPMAGSNVAIGEQFEVVG